MGMSPRLLRPRQTTHREALDWASRVTAAGGSYSGSTLSAMSRLCAAIDAAGIRDRFTRLNLFVGSSITAALIPLYRSSAYGGSVVGNASDTNNNFVSGDFAETGASSGLKGNGTSKYLNTGVNANSLSSANAHIAAGVAAVASGTAALRVLMGAYNNSANALVLYGIDITSTGPDQNRRAAYFSRFGTITDGCGPLVTNAAVGRGSVIASYPTAYISGVATGSNATTSQDYPSAHSLYVFALNNSNTSTLGYFNGRINWYSLGLAMTSSQVLAFHNAITTFNTQLSRS